MREKRAAASAGAIRFADESDASQIGSPMPGVVSMIAVKAGEQVCAGDTLLSIEAMKMESAIAASKDGVVKDIYVSPGDSVEPKQLLCQIVSD